MNSMVCDICGGKLVVGSGGVVVCESCGMEYTPERIREMTQGISTETVSFDNTESTEDGIPYDMDVIDNWRKIASEDYENCNYDEAYNYYLRILEVNPNDYDATWHKGMCLGWNATIDNPKTTIVYGSIIDAIGKLYSNTDLSSMEEYSAIDDMILSFDDWFSAMNETLMDYAFPDDEDCCGITLSMAKQYFYVATQTAKALRRIIMSITDSYYIALPKDDEISECIDLFDAEAELIVQKINFDVAIDDLDYYEEHGEMHTVLASDEQKGEAVKLLEVVNELKARLPELEEKRRNHIEEKKEAILHEYFINHEVEERKYHNLKSLIDNCEKQMEESQVCINDLKTELNNHESRKKSINACMFNLNQDINRLTHKIIGRGKALEEASIKQKDLDKYKDELSSLETCINEKESSLKSEESVLEKEKIEQKALQKRMDNLIESFGIDFNEEERV